MEIVAVWFGFFVICRTSMRNFQLRSAVLLIKKQLLLTAWTKILCMTWSLHMTESQCFAHAMDLCRKVVVESEVADVTCFH